MKIKKTHFIENEEHIPNGDSISNIVDEIFLICKNDKKIFSNEKLEEFEKNIEGKKKNILKQEKLLTDSYDIEHQLNEKIKQLNNVIESKRITLIEALGGEVWK